MRPRADYLAAIALALYAYAAVAADEPRMTLEEVRQSADAAARQHADLKSYTRVEPSYDPVGKTWGVNYRLKSSAPASSGHGVLSVEISDTTGFASTRFWLAMPTPAPPAAIPPKSELILSWCELAGGLVLAFVPFYRTHTRARWAQIVFLLTALLLFFVGTSELLRHYRVWTPSPQIEHGFSYTLANLRGVILGFLLVLILSGELTGRKVLTDQRPNQSLQPTPGRSDV
jgi:hypothetical protein